MKERALRMFLDQQHQHESQWSAISSIAEKIGCTSERLPKWVLQAERDAGKRAGLTSDERRRLKGLERENRELKRANEIIRKASAVFAQAELDRRPRRWCRSSMRTARARGSSRSAACCRSPLLRAKGASEGSESASGPSPA